MTSSIVIDSNQVIAKMCSEEDKPNRQTYIPFDKESIQKFICSKKLSSIPGIGCVNEQILNGLGINSVGSIKDHIVEI